LISSPRLTLSKGKTASICWVSFIIGNYVESAGLSRLYNFVLSLTAVGIGREGKGHSAAGPIRTVLESGAFCNPSGQGHTLPPNHNLDLFLVVLLIYSKEATTALQMAMTRLMVVIALVWNGFGGCGRPKSLTTIPPGWSAKSSSQLYIGIPVLLTCSQVRKMQLAPVWMASPVLTNCSGKNPALCSTWLMLERFSLVKCYDWSISIWVETSLEDCQMDIKPITHLCRFLAEYIHAPCRWCSIRVASRDKSLCLNGVCVMQLSEGQWVDLPAYVPQDENELNFWAHRRMEQRTELH